MLRKNYPVWVETLFKKIALPYPLVCIAIGIIIYFLYYFFSKLINILPLNYYAQLSAVSMSILIPFMLGGIRYLLNIMEKIIVHLATLSKNHEDKFYINGKMRLIESKWRNVFIVLVVAPFYLIDWIPPLDKSSLDLFKELYLPLYIIPEFHTTWGLLFDIYLQLLGLVSIILLSYILWIMFCITWMLKTSEITCRISLSVVSIFNIKMKIMHIKSYILKILLFYFSCISLAIISYLNPSVFYSVETGLLLILLSIGISFFFLGLSSLQQILKCQVDFQLDDINKTYQNQIQNLKTITSVNAQNKNDDLTYISNILEAFRKQREELEKIDTNVYDVRSVLRFIGMTILPFISSIIKTAMNNKMIMDVVTAGMASQINDTINLSLKNFI